MFVQNKGGFFSSGVDAKASNMDSQNNNRFDVIFSQIDKVSGLLDTMNKRGSSPSISSARECIAPVIAAMNEFRANQKSLYSFKDRLLEKSVSSVADEISSTNLAI